MLLFYWECDSLLYESYDSSDTIEGSEVSHVQLSVLLLVSQKSFELIIPSLYVFLPELLIHSCWTTPQTELKRIILILILKSLHRFICLTRWDVSIAISNSHKSNGITIICTAERCYQQEPYRILDSSFTQWSQWIAQK